MINEAIKKITDEAMAIGDELAVMMEEHLTERCTNERVAEKLLAEDKTLKDVHTKIWTEAEKRRKSNSAFIADREIYEELDRYYGLSEPAKRIDVMDLI